MTDDRLKSAPLAYQNEPFLSSPDGRILRILSEYSEPLSRFRREQIQDTVVFFGSARFHPHEDASAQLAELRAARSQGDSAGETGASQHQARAAKGGDVFTACIASGCRHNRGMAEQ